ncbi:MAG: MotA/TolQ/ExbB proton channel family protein [bacterium]
MKIRNTFEKSLITSAGLLWLCASNTYAAESAAAPAPSMETAAGVIMQEIQSSSKDLTSLRETIANEKIPMTKRLSQLEDQLGESRREYDKTRRAVDARNLELNTLKTEGKLRQDEVGYVSSLLDEYARSFEGRIHTSEIEHYKTTVESALLAPQNKDLDPTQKFDRQLALVETSAKRLGNLIGGARFDGSAIDSQGTVAQGRFALVGPVALFASTDGQTAGLALPRSGSSKPAVHAFEEKGATESLASLVSSGTGDLPLDPTMGGALKALIAKGNLWGYFKKGGPIMWPLLALAVLAVTVIFERLMFLALEKGRRSHRTITAVMGALEQGNPEEAIRAGEKSKDFVARALTYALRHRRKSLSDALMRSSAQEMVRYTRGIALMDTVVTMAPLLGLLGTVTGMISAFGMLGGSELSAPTAITGGIAEALIATTFGLGIAVTALIPLNFLHSKCEKARHEIEDAMSHLELLMKPIMDKELAQQQPLPYDADEAGGEK